jgi:hypothetical protein
LKIIKTIVLATTATIALAGCANHTWTPPNHVAYAPAAYARQPAECDASGPSQIEMQLAQQATGGSSALAATMMDQYWSERQARGC